MTLTQATPKIPQWCYLQDISKPICEYKLDRKVDAANPPPHISYFSRNYKYTHCILVAGL